MLIEIDRDVCVGAGMCTLTAPEVFEQDEHGHVVLLVPDPPEEQREQVEEAEGSCPAAASWCSPATAR